MDDTLLRPARAGSAAKSASPAPSRSRSPDGHRGHWRRLPDAVRVISLPEASGGQNHGRGGVLGLLTDGRAVTNDGARVRRVRLALAAVGVLIVSALSFTPVGSQLGLVGTA